MITEETKERIRQEYKEAETIICLVKKFKEINEMVQVKMLCRLNELVKEDEIKKEKEDNYEHF